MTTLVIHPFRVHKHEYYKSYFFEPERAVQTATYLDEEGHDVDFIDFGQTNLEDDHSFSVDAPKEMRGQVKNFTHMGWPTDEIEEWWNKNVGHYDRFIIDSLMPYFSPGVKFVHDLVEGTDSPYAFFGEWVQLMPDDFQNSTAFRDNWEVGLSYWIDYPERYDKGVHSFSFDDFPLDAVPAPNWRKFTNKNDYPEPHNADYRASRGCVEKCAFCHVAGMYDGKFNFKSPEVIINDLENLIDEQGFTKIKLRDDNFCAATATAKEVFKTISERWPDIEIMQPEGMEMRTASRDRELIEYMGKCNYHSVRVGFETAREGAFSKNSLEWWETAYEYFTEAGGWGPDQITCFVLRGAPGLTTEDAIKTALYLSQFNVTLVGSSYRLVPGTPLWDDYIDQNQERPPNEWGLEMPQDNEDVNEVSRLYRTVSAWNNWEIDLFYSEEPLKELSKVSWIDEVVDEGNEIWCSGTTSGWVRSGGLRYGFAYLLALRGYYSHSVMENLKTQVGILGHKGHNEFIEKLVDMCEAADIPVQKPSGLL